MRARRWPVWLALAAVAVLLIAANAIADRALANAQLDLTDSGLYTLSPGTRGLLAHLTQPVTLRLFWSRGLGATVPALAAYADRVRAMLRRYAAAAHGQLHLEFYDPAPFSDVEDQAIADGLQSVPAGRAGDPLYFGLVGSNSLDGHRTIDFFQPNRERFLEYDLTRTVLALSEAHRPPVGLMSSLPLQGDPGGAPWVAIDQLQQAFDVRPVPLDTTGIDPALAVLVVAHAQALAPATLYAIDQFVMRGGRLLALVDPHSEAQAAQGQPATSSDLAPLLAAWGVGYDPERVVGDLQGAWQLQLGDAPAAAAIDYPPWFNLGPDGIDHDDPATGDLDQVTLASPGALRSLPVNGATFTPLLRSSARSGLLPASLVRGQPDPATVLARFRPGGGPFVLAARIHGLLHSAYAAPPAGTAEPAPFLAATTTPANVVVVADSDVLADRFWVRLQQFGDRQELTPFSDNGALLVNLVGTLAGGDALLGLRGRGGWRRPFTRIDALQAAAEARFQQTEQTLHGHLDDLRRQLDALRSGAGPGGRTLQGGAQQHLIDQLVTDVADTQGRLRQVQADLRAEVDGLESWIRLLDIGTVPALLAAAAIAAAMWRGRRSAGAAG